MALLVVLGGVAAVALLEQNGGPPQTAFARAPGGQYAVVARNTGAATMVTVVGTAPNETAMEIAAVPHLFGFNLRGTVSPSGRHVALIAPDGGLPTRPLASCSRSTSRRASSCGWRRASTRCRTPSGRGTRNPCW